jgi:hypothetical protein
MIREIGIRSWELSTLLIDDGLKQTHKIGPDTPTRLTLPILVQLLASNDTNFMPQWTNGSIDGHA